MSSSSTRRILKYAILLAPTGVLAVLLIVVGLGAWVSAILREPARYPDSPALVRTLARSSYWYTRTHWHTVPQCVQFDDELLYRPRPGECLFENAEFRTFMHFGEDGTRATPSAGSAETASGSRPRLVIIGDSHAMGWGVNDDETFASILASAHGYPTANLAVSSYATPRELRRLTRDFSLRPEDILILQYCDNDLEENRAFALRGNPVRYDRDQFDALLRYRPTSPGVLPVAGLILKLVLQETVQTISAGAARPRRNSVGAGTTLAPTAALLRVLEAFPAVAGRVRLVVAVNGPGQRTHLSAVDLANAGIALVEPELDRSQYFDLDDHMRASGHRAVAAQIARALQPGAE